MKTLGTITACFPHVDEATRTILQSVMDEAKDYNDFAERLCEKALKETVPTLMIYFAYFHVYIQNKYNLLRRLIEAQVGSDLTQPITLMYGVRRGDSIEWDDFQKAIAAAIKATTSDWIACHIYIAWREMGDSWFPDSFTDFETFDILESFINESDDEVILEAIHNNNTTEEIINKFSEKFFSQDGWFDENGDKYQEVSNHKLLKALIQKVFESNSDN